MKFFILLLAFFFSFYCDKTEDHSKMDHHHHHEAMKMGEISQGSVYNLDSNWTDSNGKSLALKSFQGKILLVGMIYGACKDVCPILVEDMKRIEKKLGTDSNKIQFVLISFDHETDTPASLKEYSEKANINRENWSLLSGSADSIKEIAAVLGVKYKKEKSGYSHSNIITLLNKEGEIAYSLEGLNKDTAELQETIGRL